MSTTEIYAIEKNGDVVPYGSAQNSWLGGMHVWNSLSEKYDLGEGMMFGFDRTWNCFGKGIYEEQNTLLEWKLKSLVWIKKISLIWQTQ